MDFFYNIEDNNKNNIVEYKHILSQLNIRKHNNN
jgi:hypothetical protein